MRLVSAVEAVEPDGTRRMPDLAGKTLRQALGALEPLGVEVRLAGQGRIVRQAPAPGEPLEPGAIARLTLTPAAGAPCEARRGERRGEPARGAAACDRGEQ